MSSKKRTNIRACRVCLNMKYPKGMSLDKGNLIKTYEYCLGFRVTPEDYPREICGICLDKIKEFEKFKQQAESSEKVWKTLINFKMESNDEEEINNDTIKTEDIREENNSENGHYEEVVYPDCDSDDSIIDMKHEIEDNKTEEIPENRMIDTELKEENDNDTLVESECLLELNDSCNIKKQSFICEHCGKAFRKESRLLNHKCSQDNLYHCGLCDMKSPDESQVMEHITNNHSSKNDLTCHLCDFNGRDFADMEMHRYTHQPKDHKISYKCHLCQKKCLVVLALAYHYRTVHLKKKGGLCTVCGKVYTNYKIWRNHERLHTSDKYFICDHCGGKFLFRHAIIAHLRDHSDIKGYICEICGKGFKRPSSLKLHLETVHDSKNIKCEHCNKVYKNKRNLRHHLSNVAREKPFQCEVCSKCFINPSELRLHAIWHTEERPHVCRICGQSYKARNQLRIHFRSHTGIRPYKCVVCARAFASLPQLKRHNSVHSGRRRYACPYCDRTFHEKRLLVQHCSKRHNIENFVYRPKNENVVTEV